jgi:hypothetical protein
MGLEMILALVASGLGISAIGVVIYLTVPSRDGRTKMDTVKTQPSAKPLEIEHAHDPEPISEAPPPFSEDSTSPPKRIASPTDTTALLASTPFLTITVPKSVRRPGTRAKRKRRTTKAGTLPQNLGPDLPSINPTSEKEPSAA